MPTSDLIRYIFLIIGGLGLFLFGMKMMADGLEIMAGNRMRTIVERATQNRFLGIATGAIVTIFIQSSTATSVMTVGFINAGLMSLTQAISIIMGAHIGTTFTAHIFAFRMDTFAPLFIFIGLIFYLFVKKKNIKNIGSILLGVGILFFGLSVMGGPLNTFAKLPAFEAILTTFENPFLAILSGFIFTAIIQSSTAATGILIAIFHGGVGLNFTTAAYLIMGISIGTTVTALIASLAGRRESKRLAIANTVYVLLGCIIIGLLLHFFPGILTWIQSTWHDGARQIAMFYTLFKGALTLLFLPFVGLLAKLMYIIMPKRSKTSESKQLLYIKSVEDQSHRVIIEQSFNELARMGQMARDNLELSLDSLYTGDEKKADMVFEAESTINFLGLQITSLISEMQNVKSGEEMKMLSALMYISTDLERIGDHAENIAEFNLYTKDHEMRLSQAAIDELRFLSNKVVEIVSATVSLFDKHSTECITKIYDLEKIIDKLSKEYTENHIQRLKTETFDPRGGVVFINMITNLERCADHANNIAFYFADGHILSE